MYISCNYC
jgi:histidyl-tRNA synthetase